MNLNLVVLGVVVSSAYGAPLTGEIIDFNAIFSNETRWPFLSACITNSSSYDEFLCPEYFSAKLNVSRCNSVVNDTEILWTPVSTFGNISVFCYISFQASATRNVTVKEDFQQKCKLMCSEYKLKNGKVGTYVKPLCRLVSWMRMYCVEKHGSARERESSITSPKSLQKDIIPPGNIILPKASASNDNINFSETTQIKLNLSNNLSSSVNFSESIHKETLSTAKFNTTMPLMIHPIVDDEIPSPVSGVKSVSTKTTVALVSALSKKFPLTATNTGSAASSKTQTDDSVAANNSEQTNIGNVEQDDPKIGDESNYEEAGDSIRDSDQFMKNAEEYQNLDPIPKKLDLVHDSNNALGKDWMTQTRKAHTYFIESGDSGSNFFTYFLFGMFLCIFLYVVYHNKSKILALVLEGRRTSSSRAGSKRKHTAAYRKLDTNLEEAITSSASGRTSQIIY